MGVFLAAILGVSFGSVSTLFTKDVDVLRIVRTGILVCVPIYIGVSCSSYTVLFV